MNKVENNIVQLLTGKPDLKKVTVEELQTITTEQPYFSVAQLLLTKKMKQENHPDFLHQLQKTALYFPNAHWLHFQLSQTDDGENDNDATALSSITNGNGEKEMSDGTEGEPEITNTVAAEKQGISKEEISSLLKEEANSNENTFINNEPRAQSISASSADSSSDIQPPEIIQNQKKDEEKINETVKEQNNEQEVFIQRTDINEDSSLQENISEKENQEALAINEDETIISTDAPESSSSTNLKLAELLQEQANVFKKPVEEKARLSIETEPYYTIDYFASQGIKAEAQPQDKLGRQVLKFTDWLKQMKRIDSQPADLGSDPETEHLVQHIAASSNEAKEIVTEAMAEVFVKQGKLDKAIQLYRKLSFLNPAKSVYFAGKIEELKGI